MRNENGRRLTLTELSVEIIVQDGCGGFEKELVAFRFFEMENDHK